MEESPKQDESNFVNRKGSNSTQDSSEVEKSIEQIEELFGSLPKEEQEILYNLHFLCFDQSGCRMLQNKIEEMVAQGIKSNFFRCLVHFMRPILSEVMVN